MSFARLEEDPKDFHLEQMILYVKTLSGFVSCKEALTEEE